MENQQNRLLSALLVVVLGWLGLSLVLNSIGIWFLVKLVIVGGLAWWAYQTKTNTLYERVRAMPWLTPPPKPTMQALVQTGGEIKVLGSTIERPAFLNQVRAFYDQKLPFSTYYLNRNDEIKAGGVGPLKPSALNERRMFESMIESARYLMLRRGHDIKDRLNKNLYPGIHDEGLLIESVKLEDGSTAHILAVDVAGGLDRQAWADARQHGIGRFASAWTEKPLANIRSFFVSRGNRIEFADPSDGVMPLFELTLTEIIVPADKAVDPLARADGSVAYDFPEEWR
jgi:hypothetical protein